MLRIFTGREREHYGVNQAEDGGIGADAERESEHDDDGEAGRKAQDAQTVADVLREALEPDDAPDFAGLFLHAGDIAEFAQGGVMRFFGRHAAVNVVLGFTGEVVADVLVEIA